MVPEIPGQKSPAFAAISHKAEVAIVLPSHMVELQVKGPSIKLKKMTTLIFFYKNLLGLWITLQKSCWMNDIMSFTNYIASFLLRRLTHISLT